MGATYDEVVADYMTTYVITITWKKAASSMRR